MRASVLILLGPIIFISACSGYSRNEQQAINRIKEGLVDPESAQFRNLHEVDRKDGWIVCGEVNAKNRFGGYTGFRKFSMTEKKGDVLFAGTESAEEVVAGALIDNICKFPKAA